MKKLFFVFIFIFQFFSFVTALEKKNPHVDEGVWEKSPHVDQEVWEKVKPYLLPINHPIKSRLDQIFSASRVTASSETLKEAGFSETIPRYWTQIIATTHPKIPGYYVKLFLDSEERRIDWDCWLTRISGAKQIKKSIIKHNYQKFFKVPKKWIYPLPSEPSQHSDSYRKNFILIAEDMQLLDAKTNAREWRGAYITADKLNAIFVLVQELGLKDSIRVHNIPIAKDGKMAFIDTQYHHYWPVPLGKLLPHISPKMRVYWQSLIDNKDPDPEPK